MHPALAEVLPCEGASALEITWSAAVTYTADTPIQLYTSLLQEPRASAVQVDIGVELTRYTNQQTTLLCCWSAAVSLMLPFQAADFIWPSV